MSFAPNTEYFLKWLSPAVVCFYLAYEAHRVISGATSVVAYFATVSVIKVMSRNFEEGFMEFTEVMRTLSPMQRLVKYLNMQTDVRY